MKIHTILLSNRTLKELFDILKEKNIRLIESIK